MASERFDIVITAKGAERTARQINRIGKEASSSRKSLALMRNALVVFSAARALGGLVEVADTLVNLRNRLQAVLGSMQAARSAQVRLIEISRITRSSIDGTADVFARLALGAGDVGVSIEKLFEITETLNKGIILSGATAQESKNAMIQLAQGFASGALRGDELRSILEQFPLLARNIALELGVTVGALRDLGKEGKITSNVIVSATERMKEFTDNAFPKTTETLGQSLVGVNREFTIFIDALSTTTNLAGNLVGLINSLSNAMKFLANNTGAVGVALNLAFAGAGFLALRFLLGRVALIVSIGTAFRVVAGAMGPLAGGFSAVAIGIGGVLAAGKRFALLLAGPQGLIFLVAALGLQFITFKNQMAGVEDRFRSLVSNVNEANEKIKTLDFKDSVEAGKQILLLEGNAKALSATISQLKGETGGLKAKILAQFVGKESIEAVEKVLDATLAAIAKTKDLRAELVAAEQAAPKISEGVLKIIADLNKDISELSKVGTERTIQELLNGQDIEEASKEELALIREKVLAVEKLEEADKKRKDAVKAAARLVKEQVRDAKALVEANETNAQSIARFRSETEKLIPIIAEQLGDEKKARDLVAKAIEKEEKALREELKSKTDPIVEQFLTNRQIEARITSELANSLPALIELYGNEARAKEVLAEATKRAQKAKRDELDADLNSLAARFSITEQLRQETDRINKLFDEAKARNDGGEVTVGGLGRSDAIRKTQADVLGLGDSAQKTRDEIKALNKFAAEFGDTSGEVADKVRDLNIALLEQENTLNSGVKLALAKYVKEVENVAQQTEDLLNTTFKGLEDAIVSFVETGKFSFKDLIGTIESELLRLAARGAIAELVGLLGLGPAPKQSLIGSLVGETKGGQGGGGGILGDVLGGLGGLFGFKNGGNFTVGADSSLANIPGADNRLVAFRAQDGERVSVTPKGGSGAAPIVNVQITTTDPNLKVGTSTGQSLNDASQALRRANQRNG